MAARKDTALDEATEGSSFDLFGTDQFVAAKEVGDSAQVVDIDDIEYLAAFYLGRKEVEITDDKGETKVSMLHRFGNSEGRALYAIWGSWDLDNKLTDELIGSAVRVSFRGKETIKGGAQSLKRYEVLTA